jgi:hypothetical protein
MSKENNISHLFKGDWDYNPLKRDYTPISREKARYILPAGSGSKEN